ncbi:hypothetical protein [Carboxylicivirga sp. N1Y90]|uniref:hypothetical protein n=1 Tax=Carboxylicivirga fragile TaxID=3417571 RepID=UPI003D33E673|nr:hypothetical protein [Marinilabiliaceae bacterium N1Y90]
MKENNQLKLKLGGLPVPFVLFGYALIITGLLASIEFWYIQILLIIVGLFLVTARDRMIIDYSSKSLYKYSTYLFMKKGETFDISEVDYISMVRVNVSQRMYHQSISTTLDNVMLTTNLIFPNNKRMKLFRKKFEECKQLTEEISNGLGIKVLDVSTGKKNWIEPQTNKV